jgi:hypothetical protein
LQPVYQAGIPVFPAVGNHDVDAVFEIKRLLGPGLPDNGPEGEIDQTYAVTHEDSLVLVLNVFTHTNLLRVNQKWVDAVLATNTQTHVFAISHAPAFNVFHIDCLGSYPQERNNFWLSLKKANCRMYFSGHDHFYDHARIEDGDGDPDNDIHQFILGPEAQPSTTIPRTTATMGLIILSGCCTSNNTDTFVSKWMVLRVTATWCRRTSPGVFTRLVRSVFLFRSPGVAPWELRSRLCSDLGPRPQSFKLRPNCRARSRMFPQSLRP